MHLARHTIKVTGLRVGSIRSHICHSFQGSMSLSIICQIRLKFRTKNLKITSRFLRAEKYQSNSYVQH